MFGCGSRTPKDHETDGYAPACSRPDQLAQRTHRFRRRDTCPLAAQLGTTHQPFHRMPSAAATSVSLASAGVTAQPKRSGCPLPVDVSCGRLRRSFASYPASKPRLKYLDLETHGTVTLQLDALLGRHIPRRNYGCPDPSACPNEYAVLFQTPEQCWCATPFHYRPIALVRSATVNAPCGPSHRT